ncbi:signal peptidase I [Halorubrum trapanicum]|uniref:signal peptidase I n=1 Tax=Halorubrum trapanicum TaxID=29284 RepID=UPI000BBABDE9|nr:signal peptidase I [Halorubrum trapanicum]
MNHTLTSPRIRKAANVLGIVLLLALVAPFAVYAAPEIVGADESFVVLTASMTPAIAPGDVVIVAERDPTTVVDGDVITFMRGTSEVPVTHRVIDVVDEGGTLAFETMGDANEGPDPGLVPAGNLVGVVALTIPYIGYVIQFAGTQAGFVTLVLLPFGLLAVTEVWSIVRSREETHTGADAGSDTGSDTPEATADGFVGPDAIAAPGAVASDGTDAAPAETAEDDVASAETAATGSGGISVDAVGGAAAVLLAFAPYAAYVAFELRTAATIAVAVAAATLLLGALAAWVPASGVLDRNRPSAEPATVNDAASDDAVIDDAADGAADDHAAGDDIAADAAGDDHGPEYAERASDSVEPSGSAAVTDGSGGVQSATAPASSPSTTPPSQPDRAGEVD